MKRLAVLFVLFGAGLLASSFAFADDGGKDKGKNGSQSTSTSTMSGERCKNVSLKGTAARTSFTITVDRSSKARRDLNGKAATLTFSGSVNVNARMCSGGGSAPAAAATFELRNLKVGKAEEGDR